jgi:hypothetical protein
MTENEVTGIEAVTPQSGMAVITLDNSLRS